MRGMERKNRPIFLAATVFILAIIAFGLCSVQGAQAGQSLTQQPTRLIPPPPSAPYWTYATGDMVRAVAVSEDGNTIVAGSWDKKLYVFDGKSSTPLWTFTSTSAIHDVAVSADGNTIVAGTTVPDGQIRVFSRGSSMPIWTYTTLIYINSVSVSADGNTIAACGDDYCIRVFGRQSGTPI
jgi:WD40 repeat protein